jgi:hypothetical protein
MTISNYKLVELADKNKVTLHLSDIKYMEDLSSTKLKKLMNLILNFTTSGSTGSHFVAFVVRDKKAFYMDSFGTHHLQSVIDFCKTNGLQLGYNAKVIQDSSATTCGVYCFALLKYVGKSGDLYMSFLTFLTMIPQSMMIYYIRY